MPLVMNSVLSASHDSFKTAAQLKLKAKGNIGMSLKKMWFYKYRIN